MDSQLLLRTLRAARCARGPNRQIADWSNPRSPGILGPFPDRLFWETSSIRDKIFSKVNPRFFQ